MAKSPRQNLGIAVDRATPAAPLVMAGRVDLPARRFATRVGSAFGRRCFGKADIHQNTVRILQPEPGQRRLVRRVAPHGTKRLGGAGNSRKPGLGCTKGDMMQPATWPLDKQDLVLVATDAAHRNLIAPIDRLKAGRLVKLAPALRVRHGQCKMLKIADCHDASPLPARPG